MSLPLLLSSPRVMFAACAIVFCASCSFGGPSTTDEPDFTEDLIGRPPDSSDDPFASTTLPPDAVEVSASGMVGEEAPLDQMPTTPKTDPAPPATSDVAAREPAVEELARPVEPERDPVASARDEGVDGMLPRDRTQTPRPALVTETEPEDIEAIPEPPGGMHRCFSCVKVCSVSDPTPDCSASAEDIICGWGTSEELPDAREMARAECDATLDMAREMPRFSRIEGECPVASCR